MSDRADENGKVEIPYLSNFILLNREEAVEILENRGMSIEFDRHVPIEIEDTDDRGDGKDKKDKKDSDSSESSEECKLESVFPEKIIVEEEEEEESKKGKKRKLNVAESEAVCSVKAKITRKEEEKSEIDKKDD
ncbi:hypothetical protein EHP00_2326 [Ecytonucleospora hepatopenaei]|uniref:Uncharacterized protein n=1 Tax=Ecytonucleospora hepatopenaei TaxID=646526 RepID=A0A1W0E673_9MICR|nr:hypothetical protein EHP00_2326 [Ecytonucleospora hepatopenaei]